MSVLFSVLAVAGQVYIWVLIARLVIEWIQVFARDWRPSGPLLVVCEGIYSATDPPLRALRKVIPSLRLGSIALDLSFVVLLLGLSLLVSFLNRLALSVA
ncbi:YggT family protein [Agilicoccus flavus]|uniref:YggT family protein n=1 Tax=Agilicoccus flavus TaxID=2775968 RepID=UPI001CF6EFCC|nr:YggT family protein [Agilicoccus flavus]